MRLSWQRGAGLGCLALAFLWVLRPIWGIDVFFHVAIGREIVDAGIPYLDVFSAAHPKVAWAPFQVGYALFAHGVDALGGLDLLRICHAALITGTLALLWKRARGQLATLWSAALLMALFLVLFEERIRLRPHVFNLFFEVLILLPLASGAWRKDKRKWLWIVFGTSLAWTFMHSMGSLWLCCVVGTIAVAGADRDERRWGLKATLLAVLAVIVSPGALAGIIHVVSISGDWPLFVPELAPSWRWFEYQSAYGMVAGTVPWIAAAAVIMVAVGRPAPERRATVLAAAGLAFGALWMVRLTYYSVFVFLLLAPELGDLAKGWAQGAKDRARNLKRIAILGIVLMALLLGWHRLPPTIDRGVNPWSTTLDPGAFPVAEVAVLKRAGVGEKIFNASAWGGYLLYHLYPGARVISDGRITFGKDVGDLLRIANNPRARLFVANMARQNWNIDLLIWGRGVMRPNDHWDLLLRGPVAEVWAPKGPIAQRYRDALQASRTQPP